MRRRFWLMWSYLGNSSSEPITFDAEDEELFGMYGKDFRRKATVHVFDHEPKISVRPDPRRREMRGDICDRIREIPKNESRVIHGITVNNDDGHFRVYNQIGLNVPDAADEVLDAFICANPAKVEV